MESCNTGNNQEAPPGRVKDANGRWVFAPGVSGNPNGRPKGKTLKEFAREYLMNLPDEEKLEYLSKLPKEIVWKMAEGNPKQDTDVTSDGKSFGIIFANTFNGELSQTTQETRGDNPL